MLVSYVAANTSFMFTNMAHFQEILWSDSADCLFYAVDGIGHFHKDS